MKKKLVVMLCCLAMLLTLSSCSKNNNSTSAASAGKIKVTVTFDALKELVLAIGGDKVYVTTIIPDGTEPHDYSPKPGDLGSLQSSALFVYNGLDMETWEAEAVSAVGSSNFKILCASNGVTPITSNTKSGAPDPHAWLSISGSKQYALNIKNTLDSISPQNAKYFDANYSSFIAEMDNLESVYKSDFATCTNKSFVTGHAAFSYLVRDFGLKQNSVENVFADGEPSASQLTSLIDYCKTNHVSTVFSEQLASPAVSQTLAKQVGAKVVPIYTIESSEDGKSYIYRLTYDLQQIYLSLSNVAGK